jgi:hypothetical protein
MKIYNTFTKDYILSKVSEQAIFCKYLGVTNLQEKIRTPFRMDRNPSGVIYLTDSGKLKFNDFGTFNGDCFDLVGRLNNLNSNHPISFKKILNIIAVDFDILNIKDTIKTNNKFELGRSASFEYTLCSKFNDFDLLFWSKLNVTEEQLVKRRVCRLYNFFIDNIPVYRYKASEPAYIFFVGRIKNTVVFQAYFPTRSKEKRYINNICMSKGITDLRDNEPVIITKSYKDLLVLDSFGLNVACTGNETKMITEVEHKIIQEKSNGEVYTLFDNDYAGKRFSIQHKQKYGYKCLLLKAAKDISDYILDYGLEKTQNLINNAKNKSINKD